MAPAGDFPVLGTRRPAARAGLAGLVRRSGFGLLLVLFALAGCVSEEQEQTLGDSIAADVNTRVPLVRDADLNAYVNRLGSGLTRSSERPEVPYRFYIINSEVVNAFALPGGHIYITRGLIERTDNASELGGVLAHEIGHVAARHGARQLERHLRTGSVVSLLYNVILGREPALLDQTALRLGSQLWYASHSREAEHEADELAVGYLVESGVDPSGIITLLDDLLEEEDTSTHFAADWFSTHPLTADRIANLQQQIETQSAREAGALSDDVASYPAFLRQVEALPQSPLDP